MYNYQIGYQDEEVRIAKGQVIAGEAIGILVFGGMWYTLIPGNMANATTFDFPVLFGVVEPGPPVRPDRPNCISEEPSATILKNAIAVGNELIKQGVRAIVGAGGWWGNYQPEVAAALDVPCYLSSLLLIPLIKRGLKPNQKVCVIVSDGEAFARAPAFKNCGVEDMSSIILAGCENLPGMKRILGSAGTLNPKQFENELVAFAKKNIEENPDIGAILLECSDIPPYAWAIQKAVRMLVFDFSSLTNWVYNAAVRRPFAGYM